jgi:hypothetical protein
MATDQMTQRLERCQKELGFLTTIPKQYGRKKGQHCGYYAYISGLTVYCFLRGSI